MSERPYTEKQLRMIEVKKKLKTPKELDFLRRMLLPRTKYVPDTEEECRALAEEILTAERYTLFLALAKEIEERYAAKEHLWSAGEGKAKLVYRIKRGGRTFCAFLLEPDRFLLAVYFNAAERELFERMRASFDRTEIQWTYDITAVAANGVKRVVYDIESEEHRPYVYSLLDFKARAEKLMRKQK